MFLLVALLYAVDCCTVVVGITTSSAVQSRQVLETMRNRL